MSQTGSNTSRQLGFNASHSERKMPPRIFIGGTGRSGTSIVYKALGCHAAIHSFPREMRFLVDPNGLIDILNDLTVQYSPIHARETLYRFERLMRVYLTVPKRAPYRGYDIATWIGGDYYWQRLEQFCATVTALNYDGTAWQIEPEHEGRLVEVAKYLQELRHRLLGRKYVPFKLNLPRSELKAAKYFHDRRELTDLAAAFVDDLFLHAAHSNGKETWCEKTPQNIFHLDFLWELFPDSIFLHIKRDPRGVVHSMTKESWERAPEDVRDVCIALRNMYDRWFDVKRGIECRSHQYLELKIEDIAASPRSELEAIAARCGLENCFEGLPDIRPERVNYWHSSMPAQEVEIVNHMLGAHIERMGYAV